MKRVRFVSLALHCNPIANRLLLLLPSLLVAACVIGCTVGNASFEPGHRPHTQEADDCTTGCAMGNATTDGRPFSWKNRDGSGRHRIWYVASAGTYNYLAMGNDDGLKMGLNEAGLSLQNSLILDIPSPGYTYENNTAFKAYCLSQCGSVADVRQAIIEDTSGLIDHWPPPSICPSFSDAHGYATTFELGAEIYYEYDPTNPNRLAQFPKQFVARANASHQNPDHTDDDTTGGNRYITAREDMQYWSDNGGLNVTNWINEISRHGEPGVDSVEMPSRSSTRAVMLVHGVNEGEDPRIVTAWIALGNPDYTCFVPAWVAQQDTLSPWVASTDPNNSIAGLAEQLYGKRDDQHYDQYINSLIRPMEDNFIEAVGAARARWFASGFDLDEATRIHMEAADTAWDTMNAMNQGSGRALNVTPSLTAVNASGHLLQVTFSCVASDADGSIVAYDWDFGDGISSTSANPIHTYAAAGTYLVRCRVVDTGGSRNSKWKYITVSQDNLAPAVDAGADLTVTLPATASLDGTVTDDGLPDPPGMVTTLWSQIDGPGTVVFADATAVDTTASFSAPGSYVLRLTADDGELTAGDEITTSVLEEGGQVTTLDVRVVASSDDAEEAVSGGVNLTSSDLELVLESSIQTVGIRFNGVSIPQGASINQAYVQFQAEDTDSGETSLTLQGQDIDDAPTFVSTKHDISSRERTTAAVSWSPLPWTSIGEAGPAQQTPDIAPVIQEIVDRPGWSSGNSLVIIITGSGRRTAESYNGIPAGAPLLHVEYHVGPPNQPPTVTISTPPDGATFAQGDTISFAGSAYDSEDGDLADSLFWLSSLDNDIGTGSSFSRADLSIGVHTISATVTDSGGLIGSDQIGVTVTSPSGNLPPIVYAGPDKTIGLLDDAILDGTVTDDGLPDPPGSVTTSWNQVSGPGMVTFTDAGAEDTTASFSVAGVYVLQLGADDGELTASDQLTVTVAAASIIQVPEDQPTIQAGIDAAQNGDWVLVSPGTYYENLTLADKTITLASRFHTTQDPSFIDQTIIDGGGLGAVITVTASVGPETKIVGFTIQNGVDGIHAFARLQILDNRVIGNSDGIDYEGGGGICRDNVFENNSDDGVDLDGPTEADIENNVIRNNVDDGIEIRLEAYNGTTLNIIIRDNDISGNGEDGIQLIGYPDLSDRFFLIEHNLIENNVMAGLGLMDNGETIEDYRAASIPERIHLFNNTFGGNDHGLSGGDNLIALNNLFVNSTQIGVKGLDGDSLAAYSLFWSNGTDYQSSNIDLGTTLFADPLLDAEYHLLPGSPAIDTGTIYFEWQGEIVLDLPPTAYHGAAPDLGWFESDFEPSNPPVANDDSAITPEDAAVTIDVAANDTDPDGNLDPATANTACPTCASPANGSLASNADGTFTYTPGPDYSGVDSFVYQICDDLGACDTATVDITVEPVADPPVANDDSASTQEDTPMIINVAANDTDADDDLNPASANTDCNGCVGPAHGNLANNTNGTFTYTPNLDFTGADSFVYQICDSGTPSLCDIATVSILVMVTNDPPVANDDSASTDEDTPATFDVTANDSDADGNLDATSTNTDCATCTSPGNGSLANNADGTFTYAPGPDYNGADSFVYEVCDTLGACDTAAVNIAIHAVDDPPVANDDSATTPEDTAVTIDVAANDSDADGNLNLASTNTACPTCASPTYGSLANNADGTFTYTPGADHSGADGFVYEICDSSLLCDTALVSIEVIQLVPTTFEVRVSTGSDDAEEAASGRVNLTSSDLEMVLESSIQTVGIRFDAVNVPSGAAVTDAYIQFQAEDRDSGETTLTIHGQDEDSAPTFTSASDGISSRTRTTAAVSWSPAPWTAVGEAGPDQRTPDIAPVLQEIVARPGWTSGNSLVIIITGSGKRTAESYNGIPVAAPLLHVEYTTEPSNNPPLAGDDAYSTNEDTALSVVAPGILDNDSDPDRDTLTAILVGDVSHGTLALNAGGSFSYTPAADYSGSDSFTYRASDGSLDSNLAMVSLTVNAVNDAPLVTISAPTDGASYQAGDTITFSGSAADAEDGDVMASLAWVSSLDGSIGSGGSFSHSDLSAGTHTITATATDSGGLTGADEITITVNPANTPPAATISNPADGATFVAGESISFSGTATDAEDGDLTASLAWVSSLDGSIGSGGSFSHSDLSAGTHTITATATDGGGLTGADGITITVNLGVAPSDDAMVTSKRPADNYGAATSLELRSQNQETIRSYLKFDIPRVAGTITSARIRLYADKATSDGGAIYVASNDYQPPATGPWTEEGLTWENAPGLQGESLSTVGAVASGTWVEFDITAAIQGEGVYSFGLGTDSSNRAAYRSKEAAEYQPVLILEIGGDSQAFQRDASPIRRSIHLRIS